MLSLLLSVQTTLSVSVSDSVTDARDASSVVNQSVKYIKDLSIYTVSDLGNSSNLIV